MLISLTRPDLSNDQASRIKHIFKFYPDLNNDHEELMKRLLKASEEEYSTQLLEDGRISTIGELFQYRLFLYVKHVFNWKIPTEFEVSQIFNLPTTSASTLIKNMKSRYQFKLEKSFKDTVKSILDTIDANNGEDIEGEAYYKISIRSKQLIKEINELISNLDPNFEEIKKYNDSSSYYKISQQTKDGLEQYINS